MKEYTLILLPDKSSVDVKKVVVLNTFVDGPSVEQIYTQRPMKNNSPSANVSLSLFCLSKIHVIIHISTYF